MPKMEITDLDPPTAIMPSRQMGDDVASSSGTNRRSTLLGMGFKKSLVDKVIKEKGEEDINLLLETIIEYSALEKPQSELSDSLEALFVDDEDDYVDSHPKEVVVKPDPDSSDSLDRLFDDDDDDNDTSCSLLLNGDICPKKEPDVHVLANNDKRSSLLRMNFSLKEINNAIAKLGEDAPVNDLVDFIFAAQIAESEEHVPHATDVGRNKEENIESVYGTISTTLRLVEMGFTDEQISAAIDKYGPEAPITELADSICRDELAGENKDYSTTFGGFDSGTGNSSQFRASGVKNKPNYSSLDPTIVKTEGTSSQPMFDLERFLGKRPIEEQNGDLKCLKRPKEEFYDDANSYVDPVPSWLGPIRGNPVARRAVNRKIVHMDDLGLPKLEKSNPVDSVVAKAPYFIYGNVLDLPKSCWNKISQYLYAIEPEFANTQFFSAISRKEGYIHNLPRENRFHIHPKPPLTIEEAIPRTQKWWPSWDTRKQITHIGTEVSESSQLCDRLGERLKDSRGLLSTKLQSEILYRCSKWNLLWVGHHKLAPIEPEHLERILGYPSNHTRDPEFSLDERLHALKHCFQTDTLGYNLSVLKPLFPRGISVLSIYDGIGGAEIALHRLGIHLRGVVAIEPCGKKRKITKKWWENTIQTGELVQIEEIQRLTSSKLEKLGEKFGGFDLIICQIPYAYSSKSSIAADDDSFGIDFIMFYQCVRVLQRVRSAMERKS